MTTFISIKQRAILLMLMFVAALSPWQALAQDFPALTGRVVDQANLLSNNDEAQIASKLELLEQQSQRQFVVVTTADLQGYDENEFALNLGRYWKLGDAERDDGIVLLVAPNERRMAIQSGYGLEAIIPDALAWQIIRDDITPRFKQDDYVGGINAGVDSIIIQLQLPPEEAAKIATTAKQQTKQSKGRRGNAGLIIFWTFVLIFFVIIPMFSNRGGKRYRRGSGPVVIWGGGGSGFGGGGSSWGSSSGGFGGGGFSGGGGSFGGGGASGGW